MPVVTNNSVASKHLVLRVAAWVIALALHAAVLAPVLWATSPAVEMGGGGGEQIHYVDLDSFSLEQAVVEEGEAVEPEPEPAHEPEPEPENEPEPAHEAEPEPVPEPTPAPKPG